MKKKPTAKKIVRSFDSRSCSHRATFTDCPECDARFETEKWDACAVVLVLETVHGKHGSVVTVSECPKCFEKSWVHQPFSMFAEYHDQFPEDWKAEANAERLRRHIGAVRSFADSLCAKCRHLVEVRDLDTLPLLDCTMGDPEQPGRKRYLHGHFGQTECARFQPR